MGGAWPICPHVYPSVSALRWERCGLKDGEPGRRGDMGESGGSERLWEAGAVAVNLQREEKQILMC